MGRGAVQALMTALMVVKHDISRDPTPHLAGSRVVMSIDLFVLNAPPEPHKKDVVEGPPAPIHTNLCGNPGQ